MAERAKYQFEADSEGEEEEVLGSDSHLCPAARRLRELGRSMAFEHETQNQLTCVSYGKSSKVDDQITKNRARLDRIK